jgi:hypothetical protein
MTILGKLRDTSSILQLVYTIIYFICLFSNEDSHTVNSFVVSDLNDSVILQIQRVLPKNEICGTVTISYFYGSLNDSKIDLMPGEDLFPIVGNETREVIAKNWWGFSAQTVRDNCEYRVCGPSLYYNRASAQSCEVFESLSENTASPTPVNTR